MSLHLRNFVRARVTTSRHRGVSALSSIVPSELFADDFDQGVPLLMLGVVREDEACPIRRVRPTVQLPADKRCGDRVLPELKRLRMLLKEAPSVGVGGTGLVHDAADTGGTRLKPIVHGDEFRNGQVAEGFRLWSHVCAGTFKSSDNG